MSAAPAPAPRPKKLRILGIRGIPAAHGGFETFAEYLALYLAARGWEITVYCQEDGKGPIVQDDFGDIRRVRIPISHGGPLGTIVFDWKSTLHASRSGELCLTLGYNTAVFCGWLRLRGVPNVINMDGIEWKRAKWGRVAKAWFWLNDWFGCWLGNHLIGDHPEMKVHLATRTRADKITMIPYGAERIDHAPLDPIRSLGLQPGRYFTVIARPEPENSLLEIVRGFSRRQRGMTLAVLGRYEPDHPYHRAVLDAASDEVRFLGPIYDKHVLSSLRLHCAAYVHGHQVGGTNPSLVEALGAGNAVIARDNRFNRWVAGDAAVYFKDEAECARRFDEWQAEGFEARAAAMRQASRQRHAEAFTWKHILQQYEHLLRRFRPEAPLHKRGSQRKHG